MQRVGYVIAVLAVVSGAMLSGCASAPKAPDLVTGSDICAGEASQVYFPSFSDTIDINGAQVVNGVVDGLKVCATKKITLLSVSGNDGVASQELLTKRADLVQRILVERGIDAARMETVTSGNMLKRAPSAPIGRVYIIAQ